MNNDHTAEIKLPKKKKKIKFVIISLWQLSGRSTTSFFFVFCTRAADLIRL